MGSSKYSPTIKARRSRYHSFCGQDKGANITERFFESIPYPLRGPAEEQLGDRLRSPNGCWKATSFHNLRIQNGAYLDGKLCVCPQHEQINYRTTELPANIKHLKKKRPFCWKDLIQITQLVHNNVHPWNVPS